MYSASGNFANYVKGSSPYKAKVSFTNNQELTDGFISIEYYQTSILDEYITFGGAVSSYVEITMEKPSISIENQKFTLSIGDESGNYIPIGVFTVSSVKKTEETITFSGYDSVYARLNFGYFSDLTYPADAKDVLAEIESKTDIRIDRSDLPGGVMIEQRLIIEEPTYDEEGNETVVEKSVNPFDGYLYNEALGYIAQLYGRTAMADRSGNIVFKWYKEANYTIDTDLYYDDLETSENEFQVRKIACSKQDGTVLYSGEGEETFVIESPIMTQERLDFVYNQIKDLRFIPAKFSMLGDIRLECGDIITVTKKDGSTVKVPIMVLQHSYDGGIITRIESRGKTDQEAMQGGAGAKGPLSSAMDRNYSDLLVVKDLIANRVTVEYLEAYEAKIEHLIADTIDANQVNTNRLDAVEGHIQNLDSTYIKTDTLIADDITASTGQFTKYLTGVNISGDLIEANTLKADTLILQGDDGLYYKINATSAGLTETQLSEEQYKHFISGTCLVAESVTATQIAAETLTTRELNVDQIFGDEAVIDKIRTNEILIGAFKGTKGDPGDSAYTWIKYSTEADGHYMYNDWAEGRDYIGIYTGALSSPPADYKAYTWSRLTGEQGEQGIQGVPGTSPYNALLTNENHTFSATANGNARVQTTETTVLAFEGTSSARLKVITVNGVTPSTSNKGTGIDGLNFKVDYTTTTTNIIITFSTTTSFVSTQGTLPIVIELYNGVRITKNFSYGLSIDGTNGIDGENAVVYELTVNPSVVKQAESGAFTPTSVSASAKKYDGNTSSAYSGRFKFEYSSNGGSSWTTGSTSTSNVSSASYTVSGTTTNLIRVSLYAAGGTTTLLDQQTIPIVNDGAKGTDGNPGATGKGVSEVVPLYYASNSTTAPAKPTSAITSTSTSYGAWRTVIPAVNTSYPYVYTCTQVKYTDNTYTWSTPTLDRGLTNMGKWCAASDTTLIDGGKIYTGSITADKLSVNDLSAIAGTFNDLQTNTGYYVHVSNGKSGSTGYVHIATIKITGTYCNTPIRMLIAQRGKKSMCELTIVFKSENNTNPALDKFYFTGEEIDARLYRYTTSEWRLYILKTEAYDNVHVMDFNLPQFTKERMTVTWIKDTLVSSVNSSAIKATPGQLYAGSGYFEDAISMRNSATNTVQAIISSKSSNANGYDIYGAWEFHDYVSVFSNFYSSEYIGAGTGYQLYGYSVVIGGTNALYFGPKADDAGIFGTVSIRGSGIRLYAHGGGDVTLGKSGFATTSSDERFKEITEIDDRYVEFFDKINPITFKYDTGHRTHIGFGAQSIENALRDSNIDNEEFAGLVIQKDVDIGEDEVYTLDGQTHFDELYYLRYEEFIALNTLMIKKCMKQIEDLKTQLQTIKQLIH